jgi:hypothetical protein
MHASLAFARRRCTALRATRHDPCSSLVGGACSETRAGRRLQCPCSHSRVRLHIVAFEIAGPRCVQRNRPPRRDASTAAETRTRRPSDRFYFHHHSARNTATSRNAGLARPRCPNRRRVAQRSRRGGGRFPAMIPLSRNRSSGVGCRKLACERKSSASGLPTKRSFPLRLVRNGAVPDS